MQAITIEQLDEQLKQEAITCVYLYTPMCGTCQLAKRMLDVVEQLFPHLPFYQADINYMPERAIEWKIESVPCLLVFHHGTIRQKLYAFHSVLHLYETIQMARNHR